MLLGRKEDRDPGPKCPFLSNSAPWMGFRLSGLVKFSVVRHPGCHKENMETVTLTLGVACGPA